ncbi:UNVERIFIED_CONTAM: hypothetical protein NY603_33100, partial [Bacteroidetes bacterium 56_B9]
MAGGPPSAYRRPSAPARRPALAGTGRDGERDELLRPADRISLHCPRTAETHPRLDADTIIMMRDNARL